MFEPAETLDSPSSAENGILSKDKKKIGTYIHGLFGNETFKDFVVDVIRENRGDSMGYNRKTNSCSYDAVKNRNYDLLSENISKYINIDLVKDFAGI